MGVTYDETGQYKEKVYTIFARKSELIYDWEMQAERMADLMP
jgi:hypothetical protein